MTVFYALRGLRYWLWSGIGYLIISIVAIFTNKGSSLDWIWAVFGIVHLVIYFYQKNKGYLTIQDGIITKNDFSFKKMKVSEIRSAKYFAGDYILKGDKKEMIINKEFLNEEAITYFNELLEKYSNPK